MKIMTETVENEARQTLFRVTMQDDSGEVTSKVISLEDYLTLLESSMRFEELEDSIRVSAGRIPEGYIDGKFSPSGYQVVWREKAQKRLLVHQTGHYQIPFPDLIFCLSASKGRITEKRVFAAVGDRLYRYPFGNVSAGGQICMGNIRFDPEGNIGDFATEFFLGTTNEDYYHAGVTVTPKWSLTKLLDKLQRKRTFPVKWLGEAQFATVSDLLDITLNEKGGNHE